MKVIESGTRLSTKYIITECINYLKEHPGSTILLPTDSTYGLICKWSDEAARIKIKKLKKRFKNTTFQLFALDLEMVIKAGFRVSKPARILADKLGEQPITIVDTIEDEEIAFQITTDPILEPIIDELDVPLAVTSTGKPTRTLNEAQLQLIGKPDLAIDHGVIAKTDKISTVVKINGTKIKVLREGQVTETQIKEALTGGS